MGAMKIIGEQTEYGIRHNTRVKHYPDGSTEVLCASRQIFRVVECKSEGHINYHPAYSTSVTVPFKSQLHFGSSPFYGRFHVFKHSKADEMDSSIAEVNVTSPKRSMGGHSLLCYCCLLLFQQPRCQIHLICRYRLKSHRLFQHLELFTLCKLKWCLAA